MVTTEVVLGMDGETEKSSMVGTRKEKRTRLLELES